MVLSVKTQELDALQPVYYTNLSLAYKANKQYWDGIASIDRMLFALLNIKDDSLAKGRLIKAKCQISVVRDYCLGMTYSVASNKKYLAILSEAKEVLEIDSMKQL